MKTAKLILAMTIVAMTTAGCGTKKEENKTLVLYYSLTGNTKAVAEEFANRLGADIEEIVCVNPYDTNFQACIARCLQDREAGIVTEIEPVKADLSKYKTIFIGYPIWFGTYAPPVATWLANVDLSDKLLVPFCTFGSGGLESSVMDMTKCQPNAWINPGYGVRAARMDAMPKEVEEFLIACEFIEGEYTAPELWGELHEVSEEEAAIFDAAVDGYPMLHAKAKTVAMRQLADGLEYQFGAEDLPREDKPDMPPSSELLTVYVKVANGQAPVFTRVVR